MTDSRFFCNELWERRPCQAWVFRFVVWQSLPGYGGFGERMEANSLVEGNTENTAEHANIPPTLVILSYNKIVVHCLKHHPN